MAFHAHRGYDDLPQFCQMPGIGKGEENGSPEPYRDTGWGALQRYKLGRYKKGMVRWCLQGEIISRQSVGWDMESDSRADQLCDFGQVT